MRRKHIIIVNSDPEFLDAARVVLQDGRYNATTTNLVPLTYQMVEALGASVMVIDPMIEQPQIWSLVEQLRQGEKTRMLPIVFMSTDPELLEKAERLPWRSEGRYVFVKPFSTGDLVDVIHSLIGSASSLPILASMARWQPSSPGFECASGQEIPPVEHAQPGVSKWRAVVGNKVTRLESRWIRMPDRRDTP